MRFRSIARLSRDEHGSTLVEFALLAPAFLVMLFGVFQVGLLYQNYNAVRSLSSEAARYVMVEYQKNNDLTPQEIENAVFSMGQGGQFLLDDERLNVTVTTPTSRIVDVKEIGIQIDYDAPNFLGFARIKPLAISYERPVFVVDPAPAPSPSPTT